jgi:hypothetical protein
MKKYAAAPARINRTTMRIANRRRFIGRFMGYFLFVSEILPAFAARKTILGFA